MAKLETYDQIEVSLSGYQYLISICRHALSDLDYVRSLVSTKQVFIVTNQTIAPLYLQILKNAFADIQCDVVILPDGEEYKNQHHLYLIYDSLIQNHHHRDTTLIALGGGVVGDITGFAASTYQRGVAFIQIPTTLLAQVDASVGGKTAINHPLGKNMIGSFYQPKAVLVDVSFLDTLPEREFNAGLGEVIKYGLLAGGSLLKQLQILLRSGLTANSPELPELVAQCCRVKSNFVESDPMETGIRALLNLGHTFGHALETYTQYTRWLHGEAVAIGLYCAAILSHQMGLLDFSMVEQLEEMLKCAKLPHKIPKDIDLRRLKSLMELDKKVKNDCLRFVVIRGPGDCYLDDKITENFVFNALIASVEGE